jgi:hypothetical protein
MFFLGLLMMLGGVFVILIAGYFLFFKGGWTGHDDDLK